MLSLLRSHISPYSSSNPTAVQSSYDYNSAALNSSTWPPSPAYPSPPTSTSPSAAPHLTNQDARMFDPNHARMRQAEVPYWQPPPPYQQGNVYSQQLQYRHQIPPHLQQQPRSPRQQQQQQQQQQQASYLPPPPHTQSYPAFIPGQQVREFGPPNGIYHSMGAPPAQLPMTLASSAPKPTKPIRRTKQHVQTACFNCKKAHLSCDVGRPCSRCKQSGKEDSCFNVAHKRRGRPRLRDSFGNKIVRDGAGAQSGEGGAPSTAGQDPQMARRKSDPQRVLKSQAELPRSKLNGPADGSSNGYTRVYDPAKLANAPIAYLDMDMTVVRTNQQFSQVFGFEGDVRGRNLEQLIDVNDRNNLANIRGLLREEKDAKEPNYLAPLRMPGVRDAESIPAVEMADLNNYANQGYQERAPALRFRFANGTQSLRVTLRLARTDVFFAVLILPPLETVPSFLHQPSSYNYANPFPEQRSNAFGGNPALPPRNAVAAPPSPYYTFGGMPNNSAVSLTPKYEPAYYPFPPNTAGPPMYAGYAAEPRQFSGYPQDQPQMPMNYQPPQGQQQIIQQQNVQQLPPIDGQQLQQHERPGSAVLYGRDTELGGPGSKGRRLNMSELAD